MKWLTIVAAVVKLFNYLGLLPLAAIWNSGVAVFSEVVASRGSIFFTILKINCDVYLCKEN